ncbi:nucleotide exchange factor GrpE [Amycolatopsis sp. FDAARGOS 1241]|uniref:nucleotide exchange factor GrpE n=1 Tax=Amycolatopsis sp. FDAARGOS 1241 TaxID=2778070 RepID=UPI001950329B|nr:nucleotide exchange factor GrpE [Amycolatopsis sp. FDAARGOS 1241]
MAWFRHRTADDDATGQIARVIDEADNSGTGDDHPASNGGVDVVAAPGDLERALADREALIQLCLYALDRARSGGVVQRLEHGLAGIGVTALRPDGQRFDPALHEAGAAVATDDPALDGVVCETEVTGFADHDRLLRAPVVTVYAKRVL